MNHLLSGILALAVLGVFNTASAQGGSGPYAPPKTAWGVPDFQGFWNNTSVTSLTRPAGVDKLVVGEDEAKAIVGRNAFQILLAEDRATNGADPNDTSNLDDKNADRGYNAFWVDAGSQLALVKGEYRTSWITDPPDGRVPYKPEARTGRGRGGPENFNDPEARNLAERCLMSFTGSAGPVMLNGMYNNTYQFVQTPSAVLINVEMNHDARIIPIVSGPQDVKFGPDAIRKWAGDSVGWYEGNTLVVETRNPNPLQGSLISDKGKVTERFTRWSADQIVYEFVVEDSTRYTQSWKGEIAINHSPQPPYEYACHEGNYAMPGILAGARKIEAAGGTPTSGPGITAGIKVPPK
jgi:hypothetical protein